MHQHPPMESRSASFCSSPFVGHPPCHRSRPFPSSQPRPASTAPAPPRGFFKQRRHPHPKRPQSSPPPANFHRDAVPSNHRKFKETLISQNSSNQDNKILDNYMEDLCANIKVGDRCEVDLGEKRGVVKYIGEAESLAPSFWVGVQNDEPVGKHDGLVKGTRYFECSPLHGGMVRPDEVKVGDYPERDPVEDEEI